MDEQQRIRLVSEDSFSDQAPPDTDVSDPSWVLPADWPHPEWSHVAEPLPDDWISACRRLQQLPGNYLPQEPYFNRTNFNYKAGGCGIGETWIMCNDLGDFGGNQATWNSNNDSCYGEGLMLMTEIMPNHYAYPIYGVIFPVLVFLAIVANVFVMLVLSKRHMQSPTNIVLLYMALADLFVGIVPLPFTFYWFSLRNFDTPWELTPSWCYAYHYLMDALPPICHNVAIWLTVLLAAQRYVYIELPVRAQTLCTVQNVKRASVIIVTVSIISGAMKFGDASYQTYRGYATVGMADKGYDVRYAVGLCLTRYSSFVIWSGGQRYYEAYFWIRAIIFVWVPSVLLICLNVLLIRAIHRAQQRRDRLLCESRNREANRQKESNTTTTMLVIIVSIFLVVNCPQGLHIALITADEALGLNIPFLRQDSEERVLAVMIDNMLIVATYPLNFAIYCSMSTQFRETFKHLFCTNLISSSLSEGRTSSYYGYTPVGGRSSVRNGMAQDSSSSLISYAKAKKGKVGTGVAKPLAPKGQPPSYKPAAPEGPSKGSPEQKEEEDELAVNDTCV